MTRIEKRKIMMAALNRMPDTFTSFQFGTECRDVGLGPGSISHFLHQEATPCRTPGKTKTRIWKKKEIGEVASGVIKEFKRVDGPTVYKGPRPELQAPRDIEMAIAFLKQHGIKCYKTTLTEL